MDSPSARINEWLDAIPRTRVGITSREAPAFRTAGVAGYYVALVLVLVLGPLAGRSVFALLGASSVSALSFFGYALLRKAVTGRERLVLLEHVWVALLASAVLFWVSGVPVLAHLDPVVVGIAFFLGSGRIGCSMVGCCHGRPSPIGLSYDDRAVSDGFPAYLRGVRLFPVQVVEALALFALAVGLIAVLFLGKPGAALQTFLVGYGVLRFGLEGLRGDVRPHLLGVSQSQWMAIVEGVLALAIAAPGRVLATAPGEIAGAAGSAGLALLVLLGFKTRAARRERALVSATHVDELRRILDTLTAEARNEPVTATSSLGVRIALSRVNSERTPAPPLAPARRVAASISQPGGTRDLHRLLDLAERVHPGGWARQAALPGGVLLVVSREKGAPVPAIPSAATDTASDMSLAAVRTAYFSQGHAADS